MRKCVIIFSENPNKEAIVPFYIEGLGHSRRFLGGILEFWGSMSPKLYQIIIQRGVECSASSTFLHWLVMIPAVLIRLA